MRCRFLSKKYVPYFFLYSIMLFPISSYAQSMEELKVLFQKGEMAELVEMGSLLLEEHPDDLTINHLMGRALTDLGEWRQAIDYLHQSTGKEAADWMQSWSHAYLGVCYFSTDEYVTAKQHLKTAVALNATKNSTRFAEKMLRQYQMTGYFEDWLMVETPHIRFHLQPGHGLKDVEAYCQSREAAYQEVNQFFEAKPYKQIDYFIWSKPKKAKQIVGRSLGFARSGPCIINSAIRQSRGHEITHILSDHSIEPVVKNRLINEGVAVAFDLSNRDRMKLAREANVDKLGIQELMDRSGELPESVVYPIGGAFIEFLLDKKGGDTLKQLLKEQTFERLLELYGEELIQAFEKNLNDPHSN
jgi:tetratricopeptide (TPR) repeat protein